MSDDGSLDDFMLCVRAVRNGQFVADVGPSKFLRIPKDQTKQSPSNSVASKAKWYSDAIAAAQWKNADGEARGDALFVVHGYNESIEDVLARHRRLKNDLLALGFLGVVISFDWPSDDKALAYLPDRHRAKDTAMQLVSDGISHLARIQAADCAINVHVLAHSTGGYVVREAFDDADDSKLQNGAWGVSQILFAAADVSSASMSQADSSTKSVYGHCVRLTNYSNRHDAVLDISNVKRLGIAPRAGRIGLPPDAPPNAVNVDCATYWEDLQNPTVMATDQPNGITGNATHSWYFGNLVFTRDLFLTIIGTDRTVIPTRQDMGGGHLALRQP